MKKEEPGKRPEKSKRMKPDKSKSKRSYKSLPLLKTKKPRKRSSR